MFYIIRTNKRMNQRFFYSIWNHVFIYQILLIKLLWKKLNKSKSIFHSYRKYIQNFELWFILSSKKRWYSWKTWSVDRAEKKKVKKDYFFQIIKFGLKPIDYWQNIEETIVEELRAKQQKCPWTLWNSVPEKKHENLP